MSGGLAVPADNELQRPAGQGDILQQGIEVLQSAEAGGSSSGSPFIHQSLTPSETPTGKGATCFRIAGVPISWDTRILKAHLNVIDPELDLNSQTAEVSGPFPDCNEPELYQVALLNIPRCTAYLGKVSPGVPRIAYLRDINQAGDVQKVYLRIDRDFYDLTPLNTPKSITADVIAITGLGGHAFGSWRSRATTDSEMDRPMWLRDFLPQRRPDLRIMTYGYDSSLTSRNQTNLTDYRRNFKRRLQNARRDVLDHRPIIFIGHSLGGILAIQTLIESKQDSDYEDIGNCIRGLLLFGTPHCGMKTEDLFMLLNESHDNTNRKYLLTQLSEGSQFLENQKEALGKISKQWKGSVYTFYETEPTKQVKKTADGGFKRDGEEFQMVMRMSAQLNFPSEELFAVNSNHSDMVKFDFPCHPNFEDVITCLQKCIGQTENVQDPRRRNLGPSAVSQQAYLEIFTSNKNCAMIGEYCSDHIPTDPVTHV